MERKYRSSSQQPSAPPGSSGSGSGVEASLPHYAPSTPHESGATASPLTGEESVASPQHGIPHSLQPPHHPTLPMTENQPDHTSELGSIVQERPDSSEAAHRLQGALNEHLVMAQNPQGVPDMAHPLASVDPPPLGGVSPVVHSPEPPCPHLGQASFLPSRSRLPGHAGTEDTMFSQTVSQGHPEDACDYYEDLDDPDTKDAGKKPSSDDLGPTFSAGSCTNRFPPRPSHDSVSASSFQVMVRGLVESDAKSKAAQRSEYTVMHPERLKTLGKLEGSYNPQPPTGTTRAKDLNRLPSTILNNLFGQHSDPSDYPPKLVAMEPPEKEWANRLKPRLVTPSNIHVVGAVVKTAGSTSLNPTAAEAEWKLSILEEERALYATKEDDAKQKAGTLRTFAELDESEDWRAVKDKAAEAAEEEYWRNRARVFGEWVKEWDRKIQDTKEYLRKLQKDGQKDGHRLNNVTERNFAGPQQAVFESGFNGNIARPQQAIFESVADENIVGSQQAVFESGFNGNIARPQQAIFESVADENFAGPQQAVFESGFNGNIARPQQAIFESVADENIVGSQQAVFESGFNGNIARPQQAIFESVADENIVGSQQAVFESD
ncbi:hypothetical protein FN846DRAFT_886361 [Sphaerosporella brunnea]|uniref:Uncharacterized protein n=1 Tax=Sphaerosporella brunnea TaxID=1250544 RepID=A0A5J5F9H3_9PEZI|nr:hypothetical protein FN846DRAFT_902568 [Sphaerosporella brunnea]KAA8913716.1 hypothetical protein FN846DRAFT_886361 [Sphaerosporella brunnea]